MARRKAEPKIQLPPSVTGVDEERFWDAGRNCQVARKYLMMMTPLERHAFVRDANVSELLDDAFNEEFYRLRKEDMEARDKLAPKLPRRLKNSGVFEPHWMRVVEGVNHEKIGMAKIVGPWVDDINLQCDEGEIILVGLRRPEKRYVLLKAKRGERVQLFSQVRPDVRVSGGVPVSAEEHLFSAILAQVDALFPNKS